MNTIKWNLSIDTPPSPFYFGKKLIWSSINLFTSVCNVQKLVSRGEDSSRLLDV